MNCIIIDDEKMARVVVKTLCNQIDTLNLLEEFPNAIQAIKYLNETSVDLIFLDIHMPDFTGFDFIESIKNPPKIVLTTSDRNFAVEAFEYKFVVDYLVKPIELDRFKKAIDKVNTFVLVEDIPKKIKPRVEEKEITDTLYVNIDRRLVKIDIPSIYAIEAKGDYIQIKTETKNHTVHCPLKKIQEKLPQKNFLKVHRS